MMENTTTTLPERPAKKGPKPEKKAKQDKSGKDARPAPAPKKEKELAPSVPMDPDAMFKEGFLAAVYKEKPSENVVTRFPPEPNGYLHIGHSKAIAINFGFARHHGGICYLRYDDTNPGAEEEVYVKAIQEMVEWLGFRPYAITFSSDNFDKLYELAEDLIGRDGAYVCHCTEEELKLSKGGNDRKGPRYACPHRSRPTEESLTEFRAMRDGKYKPKEAFLRMKQDIFSGNTRMWDLTAYRILEEAHHRTGNKWRIYPTYDFTHCLCDSFEGVTHSLCTTEFETSRESYEWLCDALGVYKPMQREYGRLQIEGTVLSKRLIAKLIEANIVRGYDDPRLFTLVGLRRRGIPPGAILSFVNELGVSTAVTQIQIARFENSVRRYLEQTVPRLMVILEPLPVVIENLPEDYVEEVEVPFSPKNPEFGQHKVPFTRVVYIDRSDFREVDSKDYFRLAPGKSVGLLKVPYPIRATDFSKDPDTGLVTEVRATYEKPEEGSTFKKPKTYIQWVGSSAKHGSPIKAEARFFNHLIKPAAPRPAPPKEASKTGGVTPAKDEQPPASKAPTAEDRPEYDPEQGADIGEEGSGEQASDDKANKTTSFLQDINPDSQVVYPNAMIETGLHEIRARAPWPAEGGEKTTTKTEEERGGSKPGWETVRFQGLRVAYFCLDPDSTDEKIVLNRIVSLKEDAGKGG